MADFAFGIRLRYLDLLATPVHPFLRQRREPSIASAVEGVPPLIRFSGGEPGCYDNPVTEAMMRQATEAIIGEMVQALVEEADPEQVILFGSRARGDSRERSDVDLIVVEAEPFGPERSRHKEMVRLRQALRPFRVPVDVLVYSQEEVDYWRDSLNYVLARALREGRVMYERS